MTHHPKQWFPSAIVVCVMVFSFRTASADCGCSRPQPVEQVGCDCGHAAACCGIGSGLAHIAGVYGHHQLHIAHGYHGTPYSSGFLTGYEGLPNMDGGGVHYRYPYHSYRRPWFHPGPHSANVTIAW
ncbi:MAG: hypothetical protein JNL58_11530 [Planctomyces sp.]|nr:hypothetical protein [Planctomyces sp.]